MGVLDQLAHASRVLVIRLRSLGDCVLTTPALHILNAYRPDLKIAVMVEDRFSGVFESNPDVTELLPPAMAAAARWRAALCLNLHGGTRSMALMAASAAGLRAGFAHHRGSGLYNVRIPRAQEILGEERAVHTAEHIASAMFYIGVPRREIPGARLFAAPQPAGRPYAVIHPVAALPGKTWTPEGFLAVAGHLERDMEPVFIAGPGEDLTAFRAYRCLSGSPLSKVKTLLEGASMFIGNDSGPAHMAAAFRVPVTVLFGESDPIIWAPWRTESQVIARRPIQSISPGEVIEAIEKLRVAQ